MPTWDMWDRDQWGRLVPGACVRNFPGVFVPSAPPVQTIGRAYVSEDQISFFYSTEDLTGIYVPE